MDTSDTEFIERGSPTAMVSAKPKPATMFKFSCIDDAFRAADIVAKSTLCPKDYRGRAGDIIVAWQLGAEVGLEPMQALAGIAVINGRASLWGDTFLAVAMNHPEFAGIQEMSFSEIRTRQEAVCIVSRKNRPPVERTFSVADAQRAQLWGKQGPWKQYPERMMQMRARGFAIRDVFPDALIGMISSEEAHDYQPLEPQHNGTMELTTGTHKFGFKDKPKQAPALEPSRDSSAYVGLIDMISAATDEEGLAECQPNGSLKDEERTRAKDAFVVRRDEIRREQTRETEPTPSGGMRDAWNEPVAVGPPSETPKPRPPPAKPKEEEPDPWEKHLAKDEPEAVESKPEPGKLFDDEPENQNG